MLKNNTDYKKRVSITINPLIYKHICKIKEPFSRIVEIALKDYLENEKKRKIQDNLLKRAYDTECQKEDLQIAEDFFPAEL